MNKSAIFGLLLAVISSNAFAGTFTPEALLPAGADSAVFVNPYTGESGNIRKGTIGATIMNTHELNQLLTNAPSKQNDALVNNIIKEHQSLLPSLKIVGMFDIFNIQEWIVDPEAQPGRCLLGLLYLKQNPKEMTPDIIKTLIILKEATTNTYLLSMVDSLIK
jgi:hypothetical protein